MCKRMQYIAMFIRKPGLVRGLKFTQYTDTGGSSDMCELAHDTTICINTLGTRQGGSTLYNTPYYMYVGGAVAHW